MKNMLFIRLGKYLINLPKVTEIYLGEKGECIEVCYDADINNKKKRISLRQAHLKILKLSLWG